ncbi:LysR substrate-binding domain-containing protein [Maritalea myrionectae]|uniref:LysR substrate-binding domain-containing protein n=1 Tax=Maritalea myrionectae TaxID=454601 RepID=UPI000486425D|nr:LysR substrate-binding domain-containing protein [Maritalea myrionectae]
MRSLNNVPLSGLRAIEAIGRLGSLAAAANELGITSGALSQRVRNIEKLFGQELFVRTPKGLQPNNELAKWMPKLTKSIADMNDVAAVFTQQNPNQIKLSVAPIFATRWLVWHMPEFQALYPDIDVQIEPDAKYVDPNREDVDACIRVGVGPWPNLRVKQLLTQRVFPVCAPEVAKRIQQPAEFSKMPIIRINQELFGWKQWLASYNLTPDILARGPTYADGSICLDAAMSGQGVFMAWETLAGQALETEKLVAPFARRVETDQKYWLVFRENSRNKPAMKKFGQWLEQTLCRANQKWQQD